MTLVLNLWAGPGAGKSTLAAGAFYELKNQLVNSELISEQAKDMVWAEQHKALKNQIFVFGNQLQKQMVLDGKVDVMVTDSPLPLATFYRREEYPTAYDDLIMWSYNQFENMNFFLKRTKPFQQMGRIHSEDQSREIDARILDFLYEQDIPYETVTGDRSGLEMIVDRVMKRLKG